MTVIRQAPNQIGVGRVDLKANNFDVLVFQKGLDVVWESSLRCPCKLEGRGNLPTCQNCGGTGFVFINPVNTKMIVSSMNQTTKYTQWTLEKIGMVNITCRSADNVGDMDRITLTKSISKMSQVVRPKIYKNQLFAFTNYPIIKILDVFAFINDGKKLKKLSPSEYNADKNKVLLDKKLFNEDLSISVRYTHPVQYFIVDIPKEIRETNIIEAGKEATTKLPFSAVGRRTHYVIQPDKFEGSSVLDNSYLE